MIINKKFSLLISILGIILTISLFADAPAGWKDKCFGEYQHAGSASFEITGGVTNLTVEGGGSDIWASDDYGRFVFTPVAGDCEIIATIPYIPTNTTDYGYWLRAGVMMRGSTMHGGQNVAALRVRGDATTGNRNKFSKRLTCRGSTSDFDNTEIIYAPDRGVRMRLIRQGSTFSAWCSTNAPAYDIWELCGTEYDTDGVYPSALNLGVVVSRYTSTLPTYTAEFSDVVARKLVNVNSSGSGIDIDWVGDSPVENGSIVGYSVSRARINSTVFNAITNLNSSILSYTDTSASSSTSYVYRVYAQVEEGAVTNDVLVGTSLTIRNIATNVNPSPSPVPGIAAQYYDTNTDYDSLVGARVEPYINFSNSTGWGIDLNTVYPVGTDDGLTMEGDNPPNTFRVRWNGNIVVEESACYEILIYVDDIANVYVDGQRLVYHNEYQSGNWIYTAPFYMEAGRAHTFQCDVQENTGGEAMRVYWFKADGTGNESLMQTVFEPFPLPWQHRDIGDSPLMGNANFDESDISFNLCAGIGDIDNHHFAWRECSSDFDFMASTELTNPDTAGVNAGLAVRSAMETGSQAVSVALVSDGASGTDRKIEIAIREADSGTVSESSVPISGSIADLRLSRRGDSLLACYRTALSGGWVIATNLAVDLPDEVFVGMQSYTATESLLATNTFSAVTFAEEIVADLTVDVANLQAEIATSGNPLATEQAKANQATVAWYWYSDIASVVDDKYPVYKSDHWDNNYTKLTDLNAGNNYSYTDTLAATNKVYFYKLYYMYDFGAFADSSTNDLLYTSNRIGVSDGSIDGGGTGLYNVYYRGLGDTYFPANTPVHDQIRDLSSYDKNTSTPMVSAAESDDGQQVGPDYFSCIFAGYIIPPYTGYYSFRTDTDDAIVLYLGGQRLIQVYNYAQIQTAADVYLEAGVPQPIYYYYQQGSGGAYFRAYWKTGVGSDAEYVSIPVSALQPLAPDDTPFFVDPAGADTFGNWKNIDIGGPGRAGHAIMGGTPDAFNAIVLGSGGDIWGTADQFHYLYQETSANFAIEGTINAFITDYTWAKLGLMLRESTAAGSRHVHILQSYLNGRRLQYRPTTDEESAGYDGAARTMMNEGSGSLFLPTNFKIVRKGRTITFFLNDQPVPLNDTSTFEYDISSWSSDTILAGLSITSHENDKLVQGLFSDVTFTVLHDPGTVVILK